jgi:non-canonical (house-cleaning) NTP pyrophosphatase
MGEREFWQRIRSRVEVAVASGPADKALAVRDGFLRYFHQGLDLHVPVAVVSQGESESPLSLELSDEDALELATAEAAGLAERLGDHYDFFVAASAGVHSLEVLGERRHVVRSWVVVRCAAGSAWGSSGSLEIPARLLADDAHGSRLGALPGTRRSGGLVAALTGGLESRRRGVALATVHALSTLFWGRLESRAVSRA